jgi:DNA-binding MarR family transcriptional regulator
MQQAGLVQRRAHEKDRRANCLRLAARGKRKYEAARAVALARQAKILASLPSAGREKFLENLAQVADACRDAAERSAKRSASPKSKPSSRPG